MTSSSDLWRQGNSLHACPWNCNYLQHFATPAVVVQSVPCFNVLCSCAAVVKAVALISAGPFFEAAKMGLVLPQCLKGNLRHHSPMHVVILVSVCSTLREYCSYPTCRTVKRTFERGAIQAQCRRTKATACSNIRCITPPMCRPILTLMGRRENPTCLALAVLPLLQRAYTCHW